MDRFEEQNLIQGQQGAPMLHQRMNIKRSQVLLLYCLTESLVLSTFLMPCFLGFNSGTAMQL